MAVTLLLTRHPTQPFVHRTWDSRVNRMVNQSGRWGQLIALKGPKFKKAALLPPGTEANGDGGTTIPLAEGCAQLSGSTGDISEIKKFTSMERFKADSGKGYYVQLRPNVPPYPAAHYWAKFEKNDVVKGLRNGHDGRCLRIYGGASTAEQGILIHEAPHVGWVIGCISPRPLNNLTIEFKNADGNPSYQSMNELLAFVGGERADLFVMDW